MKKVFWFLLTTLMFSWSFAADLTVLRIGAPGGGSDLYTAPMSARLKEKGWNTTLVGVLDCKGAEQWVKSNPNKPVLYLTWSDDFVLPVLQPDHPRACPSLGVSESTLVTPITQSYHMICSKTQVTVDQFLAHRNAKIGSWNHPVQTQILKDLLSDLKLPHKVVGYARGADLMQALVSGDIDYVVVSSEGLVRNINGQCLITTAPVERAKQMSDFKTDQSQVSTESLGAKLTRRNTGLIPVYVAYNVDITRLRQDVADILSTSPEYSKIWSSSTLKAGIVAGQSPAAQWATFNSFINSFKK